jgi:hypothetical protein
MSDEVHKLSQSLIELAAEIAGHVANLKDNAPTVDATEVVSARLALDRLLKQAKELDELLYKATTEKLR